MKIDIPLFFLRAEGQLRHQMPDGGAVLQSLRKQKMEVRPRVYGAKGLPFKEKLIVCTENLQCVMNPGFEFTLDAGFFHNRIFGGVLQRNAEVCGQLCSSGAGADSEISGNKGDHISGCVTAKAVEALIQLQTGTAVIMEGAAGHAVSGDGQTIKFSRLPCGDGLLDDSELIQGSHRHQFSLLSWNSSVRSCS